MENLVPRTAYDVDEVGYWVRVPMACGAVFAACVGLGAWFQLGNECPAVLIVGISLLAGLLFGVTFPAVLRKSMRSMTDQAYAGIGRFSAPPPENCEFQFRLACSVVRSPALAIGGTLYLGKSGMSFVPHQANLQRHRIPLSFPLGETSLSAVKGTVPWFYRLFVPKPPTLLQATSGSNQVRFLVPAPATTIPEIVSLVEKLANEK